MTSVHRDHVIASRYDAAARILTIRLAGGVYRFADVPAEVAKDFDQAGKEQDTAYQTMISGKYTATYVSPASPEYQKLGL